jgi:hypothetical protein
MLVRYLKRRKLYSDSCWPFAARFAPYLLKNRRSSGLLRVHDFPKTFVFTLNPLHETVVQNMTFLFGVDKVSCSA